MKLEEVVISGVVRNQVDDLLKSEHIPHALMLSGPEGCGKLAMAVYVARSILCLESVVSPCNACTACLKSKKWIHPDLHFAFPVFGSDKTSKDYISSFRSLFLQNPYTGFNDWMSHIGGENKQANINKKECEEITHKIGLKSFEGKNKVLILWLPEYLGKEGNRLLKLFEEPPPNTHFILVTENKEKILNTIISRFQMLSIPPVPNDVMHQVLIHDHGLSQKKAEQISFMAYGNYNKAMNLLVEGAVHQYEEDLLDWLRASYKLDPLLIQNWLMKFNKKGREQQKFFIDYCLEFLRTLHLMQFLPREKIRFTDREYETALKVKRIIHAEKIARFTEIIEEAGYGLERNANTKILFTERSIQLHDAMVM